MTNTQIAAANKATRNELEMDLSYWENVLYTSNTPKNQEAYANAHRALFAFDNGEVEISFAA